MGIYAKPYAKKEVDFSIPNDLINVSENIIVARVGDVDLELEIEGGYFLNLNPAPTAVPCRIDVEELNVLSTGGTLLVDNVDFFTADLDRQNSGEPINGLELYRGATVNRTGARNIARTEGIAEQNIVTYSPNLLFKRRLKKNTHYAFIFETKDGSTVNNIEGILYGLIRENK